MFGDELTSDTLLYTLMRDVYDRKYSKKSGSLEVEPGEMQSAKTGRHSVSVKFKEEKLNVEFLREDIVHVTWRKSIINANLPKHRRSDRDISVKEMKKGVTIRSNPVVISISRKGEISFSYQRERMITLNPPRFSESRVKIESKIREGSTLHGLGEKALGMDIRKTRSVIWNHDANGNYGPGDDPLYISIPVYIDIKNGLGYFIFYNNTAKGTADMGFSSDNVTITFEYPTLEFYIAFGSLKELMHKYAVVTGFSALPPEWALGFHQSRYSYMTAEEVRRVAAGFKKNKLPISAIHMDIDYMDDFRVFSVNRKAFPYVKGLSSRLSREGIRLVTILDPGVKFDPEYRMYVEGASDNHFVNAPDGSILYAPVWPGLAAFPDFTNPVTRDWWGSKYSSFLKQGISGFWHDMNEPAAFVIWGDNTLPNDAKFSVGSHTLLHNVYGLYMAMAGYSGITSHTKEERPFILTRSGWAGIQRYAFVWTGDCESTWAELGSTVSIIMNLSLSGIPLVGVDVGGFSGSPSNMLFLRWFQMATFLPFFRVHSAKGTRMREPWLFGKRYLQIIRRFLEIRYRILPYIYTLSWISHTEGYPLIRPVAWNDPEYDISDDTAFLLGDSILVYPVFRENQKRITVKLPAGQWYSLWDDSLHQGLMSMRIDDNTIPVFVKAGSILPFKVDGEVEMHVYAAEKGSGLVYSDDGRLEPKYNTQHFFMSSEGKRYKIKIERSSHGYRFKKDTRFVFHGLLIKQLIFGRGTVEDGGVISVDSDTKMIEFE